MVAFEMDILLDQTSIYIIFYFIHIFLVRYPILFRIKSEYVTEYELNNLLKP